MIMNVNQPLVIYFRGGFLYIHHASMNEREWRLGDDDIVQELYEYKNLGVLKDYIGSFSSKM